MKPSEYYRIQIRILEYNEGLICLLCRASGSKDER